MKGYQGNTPCAEKAEREQEAKAESGTAPPALWAGLRGLPFMNAISAGKPVLNTNQ